MKLKYYVLKDPIRAVEVTGENLTEVASWSNQDYLSPGMYVAIVDGRFKAMESDDFERMYRLTD